MSCFRDPRAVNQYPYSNIVPKPPRKSKKRYKEESGEEKILTIQLNADQQEPIAISLTAKQANYLATTLNNLSASDPDADHWVKTTIIISD